MKQPPSTSAQASGEPVHAAGAAADAAAAAANAATSPASTEGGAGGAPFLPLLVCFFLSGAAGLAYEMVWTRRLSLIFGSTTLAVSTVLAVYMGGLALGSALVGRWADRPGCRRIRLYAWLEAGVGAYALFTPWIFGALDEVYASACRAWSPGLGGSLALRFAGATVALLLPTILLGATLPVLARALAADGRGLGSRLGPLYAANLFGAVAGVLVTVLLLLPSLGLSVANALAALANALVAAFAWRLGRFEASMPSTAAAPSAAPLPAEAVPAGPSGGDQASTATAGPDPRAGLRHPTLLLLFLVAGFVSFLYEVAWTKILSLVFGSAVHAFALILAAFLLGLGLGSACTRRMVKQEPDPWLLLARIEALVGFGALLFLPLSGQYPQVYLWLFGLTGGNYDGLLAGQFLLALVALLPATFGIGAAFPVVARIYAVESVDLARRLGRAYALNTVGCILGAVIAGFWLVPSWGVYRVTILGACLNLGISGVAALFAAASPARKFGTAAAVACAALAVILLLPPWNPILMTSGVHTYAQLYLGTEGGILGVKKERELRYYREGLNAFVTVESPRGTLETVSLHVNGKADASNHADMRTQLLLGHLPCLFHPAAEDVVVIGLGSGVSVHAVAEHPVHSIEVVEIEDAVREASDFFRKENGNVLDDPRLRYVVDDGRNRVRTSSQTYDVIVSEPSNPWLSGPSHLFTREAFEGLRSRLKPGGVVSQWIQCYALEEGLARTLLHTFASVFPHVLLYADPASLGDVILLGSERPLSLDVGAFARRCAEAPGVRADLTRMGLATPGTFLAGMLMNTEELVRFGSRAPLNTDDLPIVEFQSPRSLYKRELSALLYKRFLSEGGAADPPVGPGPLEPAVAAHLVAVRARLCHEYAIDQRAKELLEAALRRWPRDPELRFLGGLLGIRNDQLTVDDMAEVVRRDPGNPVSQVCYGRVLESVGRPQDALRAFREALARGGRTPDTLTLTGSVLLDIGQPEEARVLLREAVRLQPRLPQAQVLLSHVEEQLGNLQGAIDALERVLEVEPDAKKRAVLEKKRDALREELGQ